MNTIPSLPLVGMAVGITLGFAAAFGGLGAFLLVLVLGALGLLIGRIAETGQIDLSNFTSRRR